jgi:hypothetical protein
MNDKFNLDIYLKLFRGREDYFAQQGQDFYFPVHKPLDEYYICKHLEGNVTFGLYVLNKESHCNFFCIDIDVPKSDLDRVDISDRNIKYKYLKDKLDSVLESLCKFGIQRESILLEETGGRGYHVWVFLSDQINGEIAVSFGVALKKGLNFEIEFFPKQARLTKKRTFGNLIKLPLGLHRQYGAWSCFFDILPDGLHFFSDTENNLTRLNICKTVATETIVKAAGTYDKNTLLIEQTLTPDNDIDIDWQRPMFDGSLSLFVKQCVAMSKIREKAERRERLSRLEAFNLADVMLSIDGGADYIHETMRLSLGQDYNSTTTKDEITKIGILRPPNCKTLVKNRICPAYCKNSVQKRNEDPLDISTTPCSVWLRRRPNKPLINNPINVETIGLPDNVKRAFYQLKYYHENEDTLFFDSFDFEYFEKQLDANCMLIAKVLFEKDDFPRITLLPVLLPKKLNDEGKLEYRRMSYASIYNHLPIQTLFNVISPLIEKNMQSNSYGYRWNMNTALPHRIFEDWRESYPRFRNEIMTALKKHPTGYHVCCDVKGFYDNVDHNILLEQLKRYLSDDYIFKQIERTVRSYEYVQDSGKGLPQGPAYARLLANLYLNEFDIYLKGISVEYFRYVDDIVLIFDDQKDAERGIEQVVIRLLELDLELSQSKGKKATIESNTDISRIRKVLDKIHYGILEATHHARHLTPQAVMDFLDAVERHAISKGTSEQLAEINDYLPSLFYYVTQNTLTSHPLKPKLINTVEYLIKHESFFPKNLKVLFYRLLDIVPEQERLQKLYSSMHPSHKIYFLLSVYGSFKSHGKYQILLENILSISLTDSDVYVWGFAVVITTKFSMDRNLKESLLKIAEKMSEPGWCFGLVKWLTTIEYLDQCDDVRKQIRGLVSHNSPDILKMLVLNNLTRLPTLYIDRIYLSAIMENSGVLVLPAISRLIVIATDQSDILNSLLKVAVKKLVFKQLVVSFITKGIFDKRASAGIAELENMKSLYEQIADDELKQVMLNATSRIEKYASPSDNEFKKQHIELARYNECYFFKTVHRNPQYDFLEIIPVNKLCQYINNSLERINAIVDDFSNKSILQKSTVSYYSDKGEIIIKISKEHRYEMLKPDMFSLTPDSIRSALIMAVDIYKKACYFRRITGKVPIIMPVNILVDSSRNTIAFYTIGRSLCSPYIFEGTTVGNEETDIAKMIAILLKTLFFTTPKEEEIFMEKNNHHGLEAFLHLFIQNMSRKEPTRRYTSSRFTYIVEKLASSPSLGSDQEWLTLLYLREKLKSALYKYNLDRITWNGVCLAANNQISQIYVIFSHAELQTFSFRSHLLFSGQGIQKLHKLSQYLLDIALSRKEFSIVEKIDLAYFDLVEYLLLYASICVEVVAIGKGLRNKQTLKSLSLSSVLKSGCVKVRTEHHLANIMSTDLVALILRESNEKPEESMVGLSLRQLAMQALFACKVTFDKDTIIVSKTEKMSNEEFRVFSHACLVRIPSIELGTEEMIKKVLVALESNDELDRIDNLNQLHENVRILARDLKNVRNFFCLKRHYGKANGTYFPPDIQCRSRLHRMHQVKEDVLPGFGLTNNFPSKHDGYDSSWDLQSNTITNLIIPSEAINSLMYDLHKGKLFGYKISYIYSGKTMIIWDTTFTILSIICLIFCRKIMNSINASTCTKVIFDIFYDIIKASAYIIASKAIFYDIAYWIPWYAQFIKYIKKLLRPGN